MLYQVHLAWVGFKLIPCDHDGFNLYSGWKQVMNQKLIYNVGRRWHWDKHMNGWLNRLENLELCNIEARAGLKAIGSIAPRTGVIYSWLFKYTNTTHCRIYIEQLGPAPPKTLIVAQISIKNKSCILL
jgi:hypothetical protein